MTLYLSTIFSLSKRPGWRRSLILSPVSGSLILLLSCHHSPSSDQPPLSEQPLSRAEVPCPLEAGDWGQLIISRECQASSQPQDPQTHARTSNIITSAGGDSQQISQQHLECTAFKIINQNSHYTNCKNKCLNVLFLYPWLGSLTLTDRSKETQKSEHTRYCNPPAAGVANNTDPW